MLEPRSDSGFDIFFNEVAKRLYRLSTFKDGAARDLFLIVPENVEIMVLVDQCKKYCNQRRIRFLGVEPAFIIFNPLSDSLEGATE